MRKPFALMAIVAFVLGAACARKATEKTYAMTATLVSRDPGPNTVTLDNKDIPGVMEPMRMDYEVRGINVAALPADGTSVTATLHMQDGKYWVTDVKASK